MLENTKFTVEWSHTSSQQELISAGLNSWYFKVTETTTTHQNSILLPSSRSGSGAEQRVSQNVILRYGSIGTSQYPQLHIFYWESPRDESRSSCTHGGEFQELSPPEHDLQREEISQGMVSSQAMQLGQTIGPSQALKSSKPSKSSKPKRSSKLINFSTSSHLNGEDTSNECEEFSVTDEKEIESYHNARTLSNSTESQESQGTASKHEPSAIRELNHERDAQTSSFRYMIL
jgi:hypothetical protein